MIGENLKNELLRAGKTEWLCRAVDLSPALKKRLQSEGISLRIYTKILFGRTDVRYSMLKKLCTFLEIDIKNIV